MTDGAAPIPDLATLPTVSGECSAEIATAPTATDACSGTVQGTTGDPLSYSQPGTFSVLWSFEDGNGNASSQTQTVIVEDPLPPEIETLTANPGAIWPPNHEFVPVVLSAAASDNCAVEPSCRIVEVTSSEPVTGPGDVTTPDWRITGALTVSLRSERSGGGVGRVYSIRVECADAAGNVAAGAVMVPVSHDQGSP